MEGEVDSAAYVELLPAARRASAGPGAGAALEAFVASAREAWPDLRLSPAAFVPFAAARLPEGGLVDALGKVRAADLYLACACAAGDDDAIRAFERTYFGEIDAAYARVRPDVPRDEVKQLLRTRLFVLRDGSPPAIAAYSGLGDLRNWFRVTTARVLLNVRARRSRDVPFEDEVLEKVAGAGEDPELEQLKRGAQAEVKAAFGEAAATLTSRERALLRAAYVDGSSVDAIGAVYGIHRATAARWVAAARDALDTRMKEILRARLRLDDEGLASLLRTVVSQIEVSLPRHLRATRDDDRAT